MRETTGGEAMGKITIGGGRNAPSRVTTKLVTQRSMALPQKSQIEFPTIAYNFLK